MLLDGGPSRAFCDSDILLMEDDLATLKVWCSVSVCFCVSPTSIERKSLLILRCLGKFVQKEMVKCVATNFNIKFLSNSMT